MAKQTFLAKTFRSNTFASNTWAGEEEVPVFQPSEIEKRRKRSDEDCEIRVRQSPANEFGR